MAGGAFNVPEARIKNLMHAYSTYLEHNRYQANSFQHLTEVVSAKFPYFIDLDILDPDEKCSEPPAEDGDEMSTGDEGDELNAPPGINMIHRWVTAINAALAECLPSSPPDASSDDGDLMYEDYYCPPAFGGCEVIFNGVNVIGDRDSLSPLDCIVATAPVREVIKNGLKYRKTGVHIVWPTMIVTKELANIMRAIVITALFEFDKAQRRRDRTYYCRDWTSIVDEAVYRNMSSLRMIGSYKPCKCNNCATDEMRKKYAEYATLLKEFQCMVSIENRRIKDARYVTEAAAAKHASAIVRTEKSNNMRANKDLITRASKFIHLHEVLTCPCKGRLKTTDVAAGVYSVAMAVNGDGSRNMQFEQTMQSDSLIMIYAMSVRRPDNTPLTPIQLPAHAPVAYVVEIEQGETGEEDTRAMRVVKRSYPLPKMMAAARYRVEEIASVSIRDAVENFVRAGWLGPEYARVQVRKLYKLYNQQKKCAEIDSNQDGSPYYSVIAAVEGYGSSFCHAVNRDHTTSTIYFEFTPDRRVLQKCRSVKNHNCRLASKEAFGIDYKVYVALFPYTKRTIQVLPEEEKDWMNKTLSRSYLTNFLLPKDAEMIPRTGPTFKAVLSLARTSDARNKKKLSNTSLLDMDDSSSAGSDNATRAGGVKRKRSDHTGRSMDTSSSTSDMSDLIDSAF
ncbi:hypothetical protein JKP88DRAFT_315614 [Tribonema minus]|uniref:C962R-like N-terminal AEP domain-containing protein n=1 Tax=Tribonema minus TaxID=303371 RepID=A0A835YY99_9STRA|nr:hypothetical protein JKP88DRAFT_315614 [Tribonema minus]